MRHFCCEQSAFFKLFRLHLDVDFAFEKVFGLWLGLDWVLTNQDWIWIAKYACLLISGWYTTMTGVTRLYGARRKKQVWRSHVWNWELLEANLLYWRMYMWHCWDFLAPVAVIWRPRQWFGGPIAPIVIRRPGNCAPPWPPSLRPWLQQTWRDVSVQKWPAPLLTSSATLGVHRSFAFYARLC